MDREKLRFLGGWFYVVNPHFHRRSSSSSSTLLFSSFFLVCRVHRDRGSSEGKAVHQEELSSSTPLLFNFSQTLENCCGNSNLLSSSENSKCWGIGRCPLKKRGGTVLVPLPLFSRPVLLPNRKDGVQKNLSNQFENQQQQQFQAPLFPKIFLLHHTIKSITFNDEIGL